MTPLYFFALQSLSALVLSAPVPDGSSGGATPGLQQAAHRARILVEKILRDALTVHANTVHNPGFTLDAPSHLAGLETMVRQLGIPATPVLKPLSQHFTLEQCVSRMSVGVQLYQDLLAALATKLSGLDDIRADLRDLLTQISKMQELGGLSSQDSYQSPDLASRFHDDYEVQVAGHVTLAGLRTFCFDLVRSLRHIGVAGRPAV